MRPVNQKRSRGGRSGGGRKPHPMSGGQRNFDSNGPDVKIRGTAAHIFERYCQLARDANASGDRIAAENYLQHAEHYFRIMTANAPYAPRLNGQQPNVPVSQGQPEFETEASDTEGDLTPMDPAAA